MNQEHLISLLTHALERAVPDPNPAKILVVDDDALIALSIQQTLSLLSFQVVGVAATASDALCLAQNTRPDLAIFDVELAGKRDGVEGAALLRSFLDIPVVFLTGQADEALCAPGTSGQACHPAAGGRCVREPSLGWWVQSCL